MRKLMPICPMCGEYRIYIAKNFDYNECFNCFLKRNMKKQEKKMFMKKQGTICLDTWAQCDLRNCQLCGGYRGYMNALYLRNSSGIPVEVYSVILRYAESFQDASPAKRGGIAICNRCVEVLKETGRFRVIPEKFRWVYSFLTRKQRYYG